MTIKWVTSPAEFTNKVLKIRNEHVSCEEENRSPEESHIYFDDLMGEMLRELGYSEGMDIIEETERWYS